MTGCFALAFLLLPAAVLCFHRQKSEYRPGVLVPGVLLVLLVVGLGLALAPDGFQPWNRGLAAAAGPAPWLRSLSAGGIFFPQRQVSPPTAPRSSPTICHGQGHRRLHLRHRDAPGTSTNPYIAVDQVVDFMDAQILQVICYERHRASGCRLNCSCPTASSRTRTRSFLNRLKLCDYFLLTDNMPGNGYWPYDRQMRRLYPELKAWCEAHLRHTQTFFLFDREMSLYERPDNPDMACA